MAGESAVWPDSQKNVWREVLMRTFYDLDLLENQVFGADPEEGDPPWEQVEEWETPKDLEGGRTVTLTLTVDEQTQMECRVIGVFLEGDKEYIALELPQSQVQLMGLEPGEDDGIELVSIQEEEEQERVTERFMELFARDGGPDMSAVQKTESEKES